MNRGTIWNFQERAGLWEQQRQRCLRSNFPYQDLGPGVYVINLGYDVLYVGESKRGLVRLQEGFQRPIGQSGAYDWRAERRLAGSVLECSFYDVEAFNDTQGFGTRHFQEQKNRQSLEADITSEVHKRTGRWPSMMKQITPQGGVWRFGTIDYSLNFILNDLEQRKRFPPRPVLA